MYYFELFYSVGRGWMASDFLLGRKKIRWTQKS